MSPKDLYLHIDVRNRRLVRDYNSNLEIVLADLIQGDTYNVRVIGLESNPLGNPSRPWRYVSLPTSAYVGVGTPGQRPASGTFTLTWGGDTTSALAYNATAAQVQTALNALASITSAGGVTVSASTDGGPYQVTWTNAGSRAAITGEPAALYPLSVITVYTDREGTVSLREIQIISLDRSPAALAETFTAIASPSGSITTIQAGASGTPEIQRIELDEPTHDGTFTLTFSGQTTAALAYNITAADLQTSLEALSNIATGDVVVSGAFPIWDVTFQGALTGNQPAMTIGTTGLIGPQGIEGALSLATGGIEALLNGTAEIDTEIEVSIQVDGTPVTLYQGNVTLQNDLIPNAPASTTGGPTYYTASEVDNLIADIQIGDPAISDAATDAATDAPTDAATDAATNADTDAPTTSPTDAPTDASTSHALNSTFNDVEVETALNALATKLNSAATKLNTTATNANSAATKYNDAATKYNAAATKYNAAAGKLNSAATKYNAAAAKYNAAAAKLNSVISALESAGILLP